MQKKQQQRPTPGFEQKPPLTAEQQRAKARREAGVCGLIRDQKDRIERNRKRRAGDFGSFGPSGSKIVRDLMRSPEILWTLAFLFTAGNAIADLGRGLGRSIGRLISSRRGSGETGSRGSGGGTGATVAATRTVERGETPSPRQLRSAESKARGDRVRQRLIEEIAMRYGSEFQPDHYLKPVTAGEHGGAYDRLALILLTKNVGSHANWRDLEAIGRFHPDLQTFLWRANRGDALLDEMQKLLKIAMQQGDDKTDAVERTMPMLLQRVERWKGGEGASFFAPKETLEQDGGSEATMPVPGGAKSAPKPEDDDSDYQPPAPGGR